MRSAEWHTRHNETLDNQAATHDWKAIDACGLCDRNGFRLEVPGLVPTVAFCDHRTTLAAAPGAATSPNGRRWPAHHAERRRSHGGAPAPARSRSASRAYDRELTQLVEVTASDARVNELEAELERLTRRLARLKDYLGTTADGGPQ